MTRLAAPALLLALLVTACSTELGGPVDDQETAASIPDGVAVAPNAAPADALPTDDANDDDAVADADDDTPDQTAPDDATDGTDASDGAGTDGANDVVTPPAETAQSCTVWQDCGPHFGDLNSGFDCDAGQCACNVAGDHDDACAAIGGYWSEAQCFCFVTSSRPPAEADPDADDDVTCWWDWYEECDPDEWIDTSYYRRECTDDGCRNVYVRRGYWAEGACDDIWVRECSDGTVQEFR